MKGDWNQKAKVHFCTLTLAGEAGLNGRDYPGSRILRIDAEQSCRLDAWKKQGVCKVKFTLFFWEVGPTELKELVLFQVLHMVLGCRSVETQDEIKCQQHSCQNPHYEMY